MLAPLVQCVYNKCDKSSTKQRQQVLITIL